VLGDGGDVAADAEPGLRGGLRAVTAADLELGLGWADVAFGLVVRMRCCPAATGRAVCERDVRPNFRVKPPRRSNPHDLARSRPGSANF